MQKSKVIAFLLSYKHLFENDKLPYMPKELLIKILGYSIQYGCKIDMKGITRRYGKITKIQEINERFLIMVTKKKVFYIIKYDLVSKETYKIIPTGIKKRQDDKYVISKNYTIFLTLNDHRGSDIIIYNNNTFMRDMFRYKKCLMYRIFLYNDKIFLVTDQCTFLLEYLANSKNFTSKTSPKDSTFEVSPLDSTFKVSPVDSTFKVNPVDSTSKIKLSPINYPYEMHRALNEIDIMPIYFNIYQRCYDHVYSLGLFNNVCIYENDLIIKMTAKFVDKYKMFFKGF